MSPGVPRSTCRQRVATRPARAETHEGTSARRRQEPAFRVASVVYLLLTYSDPMNAVAFASALVLSLALASGEASAHTGSRRLRMAKPLRGSQIMVGPVAVPSGSEQTECTYLKMPAKRDIAVNRVRIKVQGGSHHIHLYRPIDSTVSVANGHEACNFTLNFDVWQLVLASQNTLLNWKLPPGVAFYFRAGEQLVAQTHFVDNGLLATPEPGWAGFNLYSIPKRKVTSYAGAFFGQDRDVAVPAHSTATATTRCLFPKPVKLLAVTGHYHFRGRHFSAGSWDGTSGNEIYSFNGYSEPTFTRYTPDQLPEVQGVQWTCDYDNPTDETFEFGPFTDRNEHCNLFAFYYPTEGNHEFLSCVKEEGAVTVSVRQ
jgi:hypothetical protein